MGKQLFLALLAGLMLTGCGNIAVERDENGITGLTISLSEADVNTMITTALNNAGNPLLRNPSVDLRQGEIYVEGTHDRRDGSGTVAGNMTIGASVVNGQVLVRVLSVDIEGVSLNDEGIATFNQQLQDRLAARATRDNARATLSDIQIDDNTLRISIALQRGQ